MNNLKRLDFSIDLEKKTMSLKECFNKEIISLNWGNCKITYLWIDYL